MKPLLAFLCAAAVASVAHAADHSPITSVRVKETAARKYLCMKKELKLPEMGEFAVEAITELVQKATELKLGQGGPIMFTYFNFMGDPNQTFTGEIGLPVHKTEIPETGDIYIREAPKFKCASAIFQGPLSKIGSAWQTFVQAAMAHGQPTGESRELYLYWEGKESPNNIVELQMGLK